MAYYGNYFGSTYYGGSYWGTAGAAPVVVRVDTHDGFDGKRHKRKAQERERLNSQIQEAFYKATGGRPVEEVVTLARAPDEEYVEFVFPPEDDEEEIMLLLNS